MMDGETVNQQLYVQDSEFCARAVATPTLPPGLPPARTVSDAAVVPLKVTPDGAEEFAGGAGGGWRYCGRVRAAQQCRPA